MADSCINFKNFEFKYYDGLELKNAELTKSNGVNFIEGKHFNKYATVQVYEKIDSKQSYMYPFWVEGNKPILKFINCDTNQNKRQKFSVINAIDLKPLDHVFYKYIRQEYLDLANFSDSLQNEFNNGDSMIYYSQKILRKTIFLQKKIYDKEIKYIRLHINDYYSFWKFNELVSSIKEYNIDTLKQVFHLFPDNFKKSFEGINLSKTLLGKTQVKGSTALNFQVNDIDENPIVLNNFRGKYVLIIFWATWCGPCISEIPEIKKIRDNFPLSLLEIISITGDNDKAKLSEFIKKNGMKWTHIIGNTNLLRDYGVWAIPKTVLIDDKGIISYTTEGGNLVEVNEILNRRK